MEFHDKVAIVTGGGSGIGRAAALLFAERGAKVVVADWNLAGAEETVQTILRAGGDGTAVRTDVSNASDVKTLVTLTIETYGRLDCAANVAGIAANEGGIRGCSEEQWHRTIAVNLSGTFYCVKYEAEQMLERGGAIVNFSSTGGFVGNPTMPAYISAKHGVLGLTKNGAIEFGPYGVRVNAVCPGYTKTPMTMGVFGDDLDLVAAKSNPLRRAAAPSETAEAVLWLCSERSSYVNGAAIVVDGGLLSGNDHAGKYERAARSRA